MQREYIERDAALSVIMSDGCKASNIAVLMNIPTADVVRVVRCKECKHRGFADDCPMRHLICEEDGGYGYTDVTMDEYFCSFGERKDGA